MFFNSFIYLIFLVVFLPLYYKTPPKFRRFFLLGASYIFYSYWDWRFLSLLLISTSIDYFVGKRIQITSDKRLRKRYLRISLISNLSILGIFKYFDFFVDSFQDLLGGFGFHGDFLHLNVLLPVGISFYTFQSLSYTFDIYRGKLKPAERFSDFALFVSFFPQLVAGPIERASRLLPQIQSLPFPTKSQIKSGFVLITLGMFRKVLIGDTSAKFVDHIFAEPEFYNSSELLFALLLFSVQIYADFSGYSLIARGTAKLLGVELVHNFKQPYFSSNLTEFWRRWHISLSSWLRDFVYISWLGGNRLGKFRTYFNIMLTMLLGGLWHGASWNFVIWGGIHGIGLILHKLLLRGREPNFGFCYSSPQQATLFILKSIATFVIVLLAWLFFRCHDLGDVKYILISFIEFEIGETTLRLLKIFLAYIIVIVTLDLFERRYERDDFILKFKPLTWTAICLAMWVVLVLYMLTVVRPMPFVYFQF